MVDRLMNADSLEDAKKIEQAMQDMVTSAGVIGDNLALKKDTTVEKQHHLTKDDIEKQEEFLTKEKKRIAVEEQMMAQQ